MIKVSKATLKDSLHKDWLLMNKIHYGREINWIDKNFRYKAVKDGKLTGTISGKLEGDIVYIAALMVTESARGTGIGKILIQKAETFGKKYGAHKTWLLTGKDWPANSFYQKLGFTLLGELPDFYFHKDFVIYTRDINISLTDKKIVE